MCHKNVEVAGATLNVYDRGQGTALLLVHGFPLNHSMWSGQLEAFSQCRVIAPDLRGFGGSSVTAGTVTMEQFADDLAAMLTALGVGEPVVFCGLSMGGYIAWQFWRKYASRVRSLVLCDTRAVADTEEARQGRLKMAQQVESHGSAVAAQAMLPKFFGKQTVERRPHIVDEVRRMIECADPQGVAAAQRGMARRRDARELLSTIRVPTLVVVGSEDVISPVAEMREIAAAIEGARLAEVPQAGHMSPLERPDVFNAAVAEFVGS